MTDLADYRIDFEPEDKLRFSGRVPDDRVRWDQMIQAVAAAVMKPEQMNLGKLLTGKVLRVPEYQRSYSWKEEHWEPLWNDIIAVKQAQLGAGRKGQDIFFGILFVAEFDEDGIDFDVIDGQQRLTTIGLVIRALLSRMLHVDEDGIQEASCKTYRAIFLNKALMYLFRDLGEFGLPKPRLVLDDINQREYLLVVSPDEYRVEILEGFKRAHGNARRNALKTTRVLRLLGIEEEVPPNTPSNLRIPETSKLLLEGYSYFCRQIDGELEGLSPDQKVRLVANLLDYIMNCLSVTVFSISRKHPELLMDVFEVLNNRGMELALTDVVNARIVQRFSASDATDGAGRIRQWRKTMETLGRHAESLRDFLIDFVTSKYPGVGSRTFHADRLLESFSHQAPPVDGRNHEPILLHEIGRAEKTLNELEKGAPLYAYLIDASGETRDFGDELANERIKDSLRRLQTLRTRQWRALVLKCGLAVERSSTKGGAMWLADLVDVIERLAMRQSICGVNPNRLEEVYRKAIIRIKPDDFDSEAIRDLCEGFLNEYGDAVQPVDFVRALVRKDDWGNNLSKVLLWRTYALKHCEDSMVIRRLNTTEVHLEHVLPQTPYNEGDAEQSWLKGMFSETDQASMVAAMLQEEGSVRDAFLDDVGALLVRDIGNTVLLLESVNKSISNKSLAWKLSAYQTTPGFDEVFVNSPFSNWALTEEQSELLGLMQDYIAFAEGRRRPDGENSDNASTQQEMQSLETSINSHMAKPSLDEAWTANRLGERRASLLKNAVSNLQLPNEDLFQVFSEQEAKAVVDSRVETLLARLE